MTTYWALNWGGPRSFHGSGVASLHVSCTAAAALTLSMTNYVGKIGVSIIHIISDQESRKEDPCTSSRQRRRASVIGLRVFSFGIRCCV